MYTMTYIHIYNIIYRLYRLYIIYYIDSPLQRAPPTHASATIVTSDRNYIPPKQTGRNTPALLGPVIGGPQIDAPIGA